MARRDFPRRSDPRRTPPRREREPRETSFFSRWLRRLIVWGAGLVLLGGAALAVAVLITERSLPSYERL